MTVISGIDVLKEVRIKNSIKRIEQGTASISEIITRYRKLPYDSPFIKECAKPKDLLIEKIKVNVQNFIRDITNIKDFESAFNKLCEVYKRLDSLKGMPCDVPPMLELSTQLVIIKEVLREIKLVLV